MSLLPYSELSDRRGAFDAAVCNDEPLCLRSNVTIDIKPRHAAQACRIEVSFLWLGVPQGPTLIVQGGISAGRDVCCSPAHDQAGWWQQLVGPGRAIDTRQHRVLAIDWLDAEALGIEVVTSEDQADVLAAVLDALHVERVEAFIGASYGAMVGLAFASRHSHRVNRLVAIAGPHRPHPLASAQRAVQRGILELGLRAGCECEAVSLARQLAITTYRGSTELAERFAGPAERVGGVWQLPVESWLQHGGQKFAEQCSARRYLSLSQSIDLHAVDPATITVPVSLIGIATDHLVPLADLCELQRSLAGHASLDVIDSRCGHDGFLIEHTQLAPLLVEALGCSGRDYHAATSTVRAKAPHHLESLSARSA